MIRAVIFDMDGLLADTEMNSFRKLGEIVEEHGGTFEKEVYIRDYCGQTELANVTRLIDTYGLPMSAEECLKLVLDKEAEAIREGVDLKDGSLELLNYLKDNGYHIAMATSSAKPRADLIVGPHDIMHYFEQVVYGPEVPRSKPAPDIFAKAVEKLGLKAEDCLVLEDSENGIRAAYAAGTPVICIPDMKMPRDEYKALCAAVLPSLHEVIDYLKTH